MLVRTFSAARSRRIASCSRWPSWHFLANIRASELYRGSLNINRIISLIVIIRASKLKLESTLLVFQNHCRLDTTGDGLLASALLIRSRSMVMLSGRSCITRLSCSICPSSHFFSQSKTNRPNRTTHDSPSCRQKWLART